MNHRVRAARSVCMAAVAALSTLQAFAMDLQPGLYEISTSSGSPSMPIPQQTHTTTHCISREDLESGDASMFPQRGGEDDACSVAEYVMDDGRLSLNLQCALDGGELVMTGKGEYTATSYAMRGTAKMKAAGFAMEMQTTVSATRVGDCPAAD